MDVCHFCKDVIPASYFRFGSEIVCGKCAGKVTEQEKQAKWKYFWRGMLFGVPAAVAACLAMWGVDGVSALGSGGSLFSAGALLRGIAIMMMAALIGIAISKGARGRGSLTMQICSAAAFYLAYVIAWALWAVDSVYRGKFTVARVEGAIFVSPIIPFLAVLKSPEAISGLIVLGIGIVAVWRSTATSPALEVSGPFDEPGDRKTAGMLGL
jgi:hypothetical protein